MRSLTEHLWFEVKGRRGFVNITSTVEDLVRKSEVREGLCLVNAMHTSLLSPFDDAGPLAGAPAAYIISCRLDGEVVIRTIAIAGGQSTAQNFSVNNEHTSEGPKPPKAFISYSWTSEHHKERVLSWADRLMADGVNVVIDRYDLKEGDDKNFFMEQMVTNKDVSHVLIVCDKVYAQKADSRKAGVGTETQIISKEVYDKVVQSKFIPIICEFLDNGEPAFPTFFKSRIGIDFSTAEKVSENWEQLVRLLHGKPRLQKPALGNAPAYIREDAAAPASPIRAKFDTLRQAILQQRPTVPALRREFVDACISYSDALRTREQPTVEPFGKKIVDDCRKLIVVRDGLIDWISLESEAQPSQDFTDALLETLERLLEQKARPNEVKQWNDVWFDAHEVFVYETFLYIVAALLKTGAYDTLHTVFTSHYIRPESQNNGMGNDFFNFSAFYGHSQAANAGLDGLDGGSHYLSAAAEIIKRQASRTNLPFTELMQAELVVQLMSFITPNTHWFPQTLHYAMYSPTFPFFVRAARKRDFDKLAKITGIADPATLKVTAKAGWDKYDKHSFARLPNLFNSMNLDKLGSLS